MRALPFLLSGLTLASATRGAHAHEPGETGTEPESLDVVVLGDAPGGDAASRVRYGRRELELRPRLRPGDVVEAVPGVFAVQHAGGGKANQFFLRGFDADHGTDVRITVDDVPANMVSHGHGQGYADLHFLIPELVVDLEGYKGAAYAHLGDFATAGAIEMKLAETFDESWAQYSVGQYGIMRGLAVVSPRLGDGWRSVVAGELFRDDGPFDNEEDLERFNFYAKVARDVGERSKIALSLMSYGSGWKGSGQIPARAVCGEGEVGTPSPEDQGETCIDRFGTVDPSEGGATQRHAVRLALDTAWDDDDVAAIVYVMRQSFTLYSNFTFFAEDPVRGDGIEQTDDRTMIGTDVRYHRHARIGRSAFKTTLGLQARFDDIDNTLYAQDDRERLAPRVDASIAESGLGLFVEEDARLTPWLRGVIGLRLDRVDVRVNDHLEQLADGGTSSSGTAGDAALSPKASVVVTPLRPWDLFASAGRGFHSNDARGAVLDVAPVDLITVAKTYEVGTRVEPIDGLTFDAAGFLIDLDAETVWIGDAGGTEISGATRRVGAELSGRFKHESWLFADAAVTFVDARYRTDAGGGDAIPLAPRRTFTLGGGLRPTLGDFIPSFGFRLKSLADRPAIEDDSLVAEGFTTVDVNAALRWKNLELGLDVQNLFDATYREVSFATETRLAYEPAPVTGIHYSPGWPFTAIGRAAVYWE